MGYMAGVTNDPYAPVVGDTPIAVYDKFVYGFGTSARMLNVYVQSDRLVHGCSSAVHAEMEVEFAIVAMAVYFHGDVVDSNSYEGIVERAAALVSLKLEDFVEYGHRMIKLEEHPQLLADVIEYLMSVK
jgi:hypothetical protein